MNTPPDPRITRFFIMLHAARPGKCPEAREVDRTSHWRRLYEMRLQFIENFRNKYGIRSTRP